MGIKFEAMKTIGEYLSENCKDEKVIAAWNDIRNSYTRLIGELLNLQCKYSEISKENEQKSE